MSFAHIQGGTPPYTFLDREAAWEYFYNRFLVLSKTAKVGISQSFFPFSHPLTIVLETEWAISVEHDAPLMVPQQQRFRSPRIRVRGRSIAPPIKCKGIILGRTEVALSVGHLFDGWH